MTNPTNVLPVSIKDSRLGEGMLSRTTSGQDVSTCETPVDYTLDSSSASEDDAFNLSTEPATMTVSRRRLSSEVDQIPNQSIAARLPSELILEILKYLLSTQDLHATLLTCRLWSECSVEMLWYKPILYTPPALLKMLSTIRKESMTYEYPTFVRRLNLSYLADQISDAILLKLQPCRRLERLTLVNCKRVTDRGLCDIISRNVGLIALDVTNLDAITDLSVLVAASRNKNLQGLNLSGCLKITDDAITSIAVSCPSLRRVGHPYITQVNTNVK